MMISSDPSLDDTTYQPNWYKEGDGFNKSHHQVPTQTTAMDNIISTHISAATLLCAKFEGNKIYWIQEGIPTGLQVQILQGHRCHSCQEGQPQVPQVPSQRPHPSQMPQ